MKDHEKRELVSELVGIASIAHGTEQLRDRIACALSGVFSAIDGVTGRAEKAEAELAKLREQKPMLYYVEQILNGEVVTSVGNYETFGTLAAAEERARIIRLKRSLDSVTVIPLYVAPVPAVAAPAVPEELLKCWLIERPASSEWPAIWLTITTDGRRWVSDGGTMYSTGGDWYFTAAAIEALKFADKESADEYVRHNKIKDVMVTEHIFDNRALLQSATQADKEV